MTDKQRLFQYCLRQGDTHIIFGYRMGEWCSNAHILEEDIALTNIALDHMGLGNAWLERAAEEDSEKRTPDDLAYRRNEREYYNLLLAEQPNGNFADTIARQFLFDVYSVLYYSELVKSADDTIAGIAGKGLKEVRYHFKHSAQWVVRLGDGTEESHHKMQAALDDMWRFTDELFEMDETDEIMAKSGVGVNVSGLKESWIAQVKEILQEATLTVPDHSLSRTGSKLGVHTEHLGHILAEMQYLPRAYPNAQW